jgi:excisionase family DNA binding protein
MIDQEYLTPSELAKLIRFSEIGVRRWIATRRIGVVRLGRRVLIPRSELQRLVDLGYTPARSNR